MSSISGLNHAASELAVYASQSASRRPTQDSLAAGGQPLAARDWLPAGLQRSFNHHLMASSSPGFAWRNLHANQLERSAEGFERLLQLVF